MEAYKKLNADLVAQLQDYKQKQRLFELKQMQLMQESLIHQRLIREQKVIIESFVMQNSQDLNQFLNLLVSGHKQNMTVVAEFVQEMLRKLESLLIHISTDSSSNRPQPKPPQPVEVPGVSGEASKVTMRAVRVHRSLSPVAKSSNEQAEGGPLGSRMFKRTEAEQDGEEEDSENLEPAVQNFVTKRRRNLSPRHFDFDEEETGDAPPEVGSEPLAVERMSVPACDPITLPDGMLSTIPETSQDGLNGSVPQVQEEEEDSEDEDATVDEGTVAMTDEEEEQPQTQPVPEPEPEPEPEDQENQENEIIAIDEVTIVASSTPNPRKRMISLRSVLSPVDTNRVEARVKRTRTPMPRKRVTKEAQPEEENDISLTLRPRRRAAPQSLAEPSLRDKLRR